MAYMYSRIPTGKGKNSRVVVDLHKDLIAMVGVLLIQTVDRSGPSEDIE